MLPRGPHKNFVVFLWHPQRWAEKVCKIGPENKNDLVQKNEFSQSIITTRIVGFGFHNLPQYVGICRRVVFFGATGLIAKLSKYFVKEGATFAVLAKLENLMTTPSLIFLKLSLDICKNDNHTRLFL